MKKVLFMVSSMKIGGVEKSLLSLLSVIPKDKYEVTILMLEKKGGFLDKLPQWVKVEEVQWFKKIKPIIMQPPKETIKSYIKNKEYFKILPFIYSYFMSEKKNDRHIYYKHVFTHVPKHKEEYDVAIAYAGPTDVIDYYIAHKIKAKKKISWIHFDISKHKVNSKLYTKLYEKFHKIFVVSKEAKIHLDNIIPKAKHKTETFLNIVSKTLINNMSKEKIDMDESFNGIKVVTVGRLSKEKGQDLAIKALHKLKKEGYKVKWYCVGEGPARNEYENLIEELNLENEFILLGATNNPYPYIAKSDIYVQTSRHEGFCLTLAEAKCLNKPIVTTDFTGAKEQINHGENGYIVSCDENELYKEIKVLIEDIEKRKSFEKALSLEHFDTTTEVNKLYQAIG
ncbi:glycosyltransferase [Clostridium tarantellae]|uniref:Glycosyltransferase n=1 Tax=Clostridium tarantellae TaxID=39493 RepID=A0A6I1MMY3_9CLOT|nr:glycosyltransferase [Clostridium tarantellae]MPQ42281.1 glycosyltransferase [Clostridium tarantellae]